MKLNFFLMRTLSLLLLLSFSFFSCKQAEEKPVTPLEAKEFAKKLQSSIEKRNPEFMNEAMDKKGFLKKAGLGAGKDAKAFGSGVENGMKMGTNVTGTISKKATYQLVKTYEKEQVQHVLFRLYDDGSLNYHDIELTKKGGEVKIADIFVYTTGEYLSETIGGLFKQMKSVMDTKSPSAKDEQWLKQLPVMRKLMNEGKFTEALEIYEKLPANVQQMRAVQIVHVLICSGIDDLPQYNSAIEEYQRLYPNEPNMHLLLLDGYAIRKEYDKALDAVNQMDKMINTDPLLDYYRYLFNTLKDDEVNAKLCLERLMKNMPDFEDGMLEIIALRIDEENTDSADEWIARYKQSSANDQDKLEQLLMVKGYEKL